MTTLKLSPSKINEVHFTLSVEGSNQQITCRLNIHNSNNTGKYYIAEVTGDNLFLCKIPGDSLDTTQSYQFNIEALWDGYCIKCGEGNIQFEEIAKPNVALSIVKVNDEEINQPKEEPKVEDNKEELPQSEVPKAPEQKIKESTKKISTPLKEMISNQVQTAIKIRENSKKAREILENHKSKQ